MAWQVCCEVVTVADENIKQHFRPDEGPIIDKLLGMIAIAHGQYRPVLTDFLNPRQVYIANSLVNREDDIKIKAWGGYQAAEMQRCLIYPDYYQPSLADFNLQLFSIDYPQKFTELHHRQIMGTLISDGLERSAFGDILHDQDNWQLLVKKELNAFIQDQVDRIGRNHIRMKEIPFDQIIQPEDDYEMTQTTVSSLRLDAVISAAFHYSRNRAKESIKRGYARVNWKVEERSDYELAVNDLISVRHAGRFKLISENGKNKKQHWRLQLAIIMA